LGGRGFEMLFKTIVKHGIEEEYQAIIEAKNMKDAFDRINQFVEWLFHEEIESIELLQPLFCPCPKCGTEQIEGIGCPNEYCLGKNKIKA
jgi:hypothetical protein